MKPIIPTTIAALAVLAASARAQTPADAPGVHDGAKVFSAGAVKEAVEALREVRDGSDGHWQVLIDTVDSLGGKTARERAVVNAEKTRLKGLSVVIAKKEHQVFVEPSRSAEAAFPHAERELVVAAFTNAFKKNDFDRGLRDAVAEVRFVALKTGVRDAAGMFSADAVAKADAALDAVRRKTRWQAAIETVDSLGGKTRKDVAVRNAQALQVHGLYLLIAKQEKQYQAEPSRSAERVFGRDRIKAIDDALASGFKAGEFDRGLLDAVAAIRRTAEQDTTAVTQNTTPVAAKPSAPESEEHAVAPVPATTPARPAPAPAPADRGPDVRVTESGSVLPLVLIGGGAVLLVLWLVSRAFRRPPQPAYPPQSQAYAGGPGYPQGPAPAVPPASAPRPGYGGPPPQAPGYGYGPPQGPAPGYGYGAPPPPQGGGAGGLVTGALGGLGGAIAGNLLYDQLAHRHQGGEGPAHVPGGVVPPSGSAWPQGGTGAGAGADAGSPPPAETYDPNAGAGGGWDDPGTSPAPDADQAGAGGNWGTPEEPAADAGAGGSWGDGGAPDAPEGGSWGTPEPEPEPEPAPDAGGDWSSSEPADTGEEQGGGGSW